MTSDFVPCHQSLDCALNRWTRPEAPTDSKSCLEKEGGVLPIAFAMQQCVRELEILSALPGPAYFVSGPTT